jgi:hypothetical protein
MNIDVTKNCQHVYIISFYAYVFFDLNALRDKLIAMYTPVSVLYFVSKCDIR